MDKEIYLASWLAHSALQVPAPKGLSYMPQQLAAIEYADRVRNAIFGDKPGSGKTIMVAGYLNHHPEIQKVLIVAPASLTGLWLKELKKWLVEPRRTQVYWNQREKIWNPQILICSYNMMNNGFVPLFIKKKWGGKFDLLVLDELHNLKNPSAQRTKNVLSKSGVRPLARKVIGLTGTPIPNRPKEIYHTTMAFDPTCLDSKTFIEYAYKYCKAFNDRFGFNTNGSSNEEELGVRLRSHMMIRRRDEDIMAQLPEKSRAIIELEMSTTAKALVRKHKAYNEDDILAMRGGIGSFEGLSEERRLLGLEKLKPGVEYLLEQLEARDKIVVFTHHRELLTEVCKDLEKHKVKCVSITGETPVKQRQPIVDKFQEDPEVKVFLGTIGSCKEGFTLTASHYAVMFECDWVPGNNEQAEGRLHRKGQRHPVLIDYLVFPGSLDARILKVQTAKAVNIRKVLDNPNEPKEVDMLEQAIEKVVKKAVAAALAEWNPPVPNITVVPAVDPKPVTPKAEKKKAEPKQAVAEVDVIDPRPKADAVQTVEPDPGLGSDFEDFGTPEKVNAISDDDCMQAIQAYAKKHGKEQAVALLGKFKVMKSKDVPQERREEFLKATK